MSDDGLQELLAERTLALCRVPSVIGDEAALCSELEGRAKASFGQGRVRRISHSLVIGALDDPRPSVALIGHLDTVPVHPADGVPRRAGGRVVGLGSSDMKGGLAVIQTLLERLPLAQLPVNVVAVLYEREEGPFLENGLGPVLAAVPELSAIRLGIALEPTDNVVQVGCVGTLHATLRFHGKSAHSARPWQGENAIHKAGTFLAELAARQRHEVLHAGHTFYEVMSITKAAGGRARNVIPELFELNLNYRFAPGKSLEQAQRDVSEMVAGRADVTFVDLSPSGRVPQGNRYFDRLLAASGAPAQPKQAWTDVGRLSELGIDAVNYGPGDTAQAHQANESCSESALAHCYHRLATFLRDS